MLPSFASISFSITASKPCCPILYWICFQLQDLVPFAGFPSCASNSAYFSSHLLLCLTLLFSAMQLTSLTFLSFHTVLPQLVQSLLVHYSTVSVSKYMTWRLSQASHHVLIISVYFSSHMSMFLLLQLLLLRLKQDFLSSSVHLLRPLQGLCWMINIMCGLSSNKLTRLFFLLESPENIVAFITVETCFTTDLYWNDVKQDKWVVSMHYTDLPGTFLLHFFELVITLFLSKVSPPREQ